MKKPHFNLRQRTEIRNDTLLGAQLTFNLAILKWQRELRKEHGYFESRRIVKMFLNAINKSTYWKSDLRHS